jgi:hypothetical protein
MRREPTEPLGHGGQSPGMPTNPARPSRPRLRLPIGLALLVAPVLVTGCASGTAPHDSSAGPTPRAAAASEGSLDGSLDWSGVCDVLDCVPAPVPPLAPEPEAAPPPPPPTVEENPCPTLWSCGPYRSDEPRDDPPRDEVGTSHPGTSVIGPNPHSKADYIGDPVRTTPAPDGSTPAPTTTVEPDGQ